MSGLAVSGLMAGLGREYADLMAFDAWYEKEQAERPGAEESAEGPEEAPRIPGDRRVARYRRWAVHPGGA